MIKTVKRVQHVRRFSEDFKLKVVEEYEKGLYSIGELESIYGVRNPTIYNWIYKFSKYNKKSIQVVEMKDSQSEKIKAQELRIKELERAVGQKQMNIDYLEKMIEIAKETYNIDIKKNSNTPQSSGSNPTKG